VIRDFSRKYQMIENTKPPKMNHES
jgi:hypothetical protein